MAWRKRDQNDGPESVELVVAGTGVLVQGTPSAVMAYVDQMTALVSSNSTKRVLADGLAVAGSVAALVDTHREYFEFSPRAMELLRKHGAIPTKDGFNRGFVRSGPAGNSPFAGNLDWRSVSLGPAQALAAQTMLATLALRAAIQDLAAAVERVEARSTNSSPSPAPNESATPPATDAPSKLSSTGSDLRGASPVRIGRRSPASGR